MYNNGKIDENLSLRIFFIKKDEISTEILNKKNIKIEDNVFIIK